MIIKAQATRPGQTAPEPEGAARFALKNKADKSKTPYVFAMFLLAVGVYLKSIFPGWGRVEDEAQQRPEDEGKIAPEEQLAQAEPPPALDQETVTGTVGQGANRAGGSGSGLVELQPPAIFPLIESPQLGDFLLPERPISWMDTPANPFRSLAANDNGGGLAPTAPGWSWPVTPVPATPIPFPPRAEDKDPVGPGPGSGPGDGDGDGDGETPGGPGPGGEEPCDGTPGGPCDDDDEVACDGGQDNPCASDDEAPGGCSPQDPCADDDDEQQAGGNRAPRNYGPVYLMDVTGCVVLSIALAHLLRNTFDPDGDALVVQNLRSSSGTLTPTAEGFDYMADAGWYGDVTISYEISDGTASIAQTALFSVLKRPVLTGSEQDDEITGTDCADEIAGGPGNDLIEALGGPDIVCGGPGNDVIRGGAGNDTLFGGAGDDVIHGGDGDDHISGGEGNDQLFGEAGDDIIFGDAGDDLLDGGEGNDMLFGGAGNDRLIGGAGDDRLDGGSGNDQLSGGEGNDVLLGGDGDDLLEGNAGDDTVDGGAGNDTIHGGDGNDTLLGGAGDDVIYDGAGSDHVDAGDGNDIVVAAMDGEDDVYLGGDGCDTLDYSAAQEDLVIDVSGGTASGIEIGDDTIGGFEEFIGGAGDDHFIAGDESATFVGGEGSNIFEFLGPTDFSAQAQPLIFEILDFKAGDRLRMSKYDLFEKVFDRFEDEFEQLYGKDIDDDDVRLRLRHEDGDGYQRTVIEADFNRDHFYETTITLEGRHLLVVVETA